jgi:CBS domain-containing protein
MQEMRDEAKAEEQQIAEEREHSEARLEPLAGLTRQVRELLSILSPPVALEHRATVREALESMRDHQLSCVLVVEQDQLVGIFTERDVVATVASASLAIDHVLLRDVMRPDPECLGLDDTLVDALHQMAVGEYRHVPVVDEQGRPTALVSMQAIVDTLLATLPQELLNRPRPRRTVTRPHPPGKARKPPAPVFGTRAVVTKPKRDAGDEGGRSLGIVTHYEWRPST